MELREQMENRHRTLWVIIILCTFGIWEELQSQEPKSQTEIEGLFEKGAPDNFGKERGVGGVKALIPTGSRTWTDINRNTTLGIVSEFDSKNELATLRLGQGKVLESFPIAKLSALDQEFLRNASKAILSGRVVGVHDGDSFTLLVAGNTQFKIRLESIDAPELGQEFGNNSKKGLSDLIFGKAIRVLITGKDKYSRYLGIPTIDGINVNHEMVKRGHAWHFKEYSDSKELAAAEAKAKAEKQGLWSAYNPMSPWDYRTLQKRNAFEKLTQVKTPPVSSFTSGAEKERTMPAEKPAASFWLNTGSNIRHNGGCRWFGKTKNGRFCSGGDGKACGTCGG